MIDKENCTDPTENLKAPSGRDVRAFLELTILMPCLNEAETVARCIRKATSFLDTSRVKGEVLIADNGSADGSQKIAQGLGARIISVRERGYGAALQGGLQAARGRYVIMGDADDSYDFSNLSPFLEQLRAGSDLVMGNRFLGGIRKGAMPMLHRYIGNPILSLLGRMFFHIPVGDFHCGLRGFRTEAMRALKLQTAGMEFASEMVVRGALAGLKITEVPTTLDPDGRTRAPHLRTWRDGWRHLKFLLMYSPRWLFLIPGAALMGLGGLLGCALFFGPIQFGANLVLDINSFTFACFLLVAGTQILTFGGLSKYYATVTGFLPRTRRANALVHYASTDRLLLISGFVFAAGLAVFGYAAVIWAGSHFGPLTDPKIPRAVIGGLTLQLIGVQTFFSAFLLGVLEIPLSKTPPNPFSVFEEAPSPTNEGEDDVA